jgi:hypothetical protein
MVDNAFVDIDDFALAQRIADRMKPASLHRKLDRFARWLCPAAAAFPGCARARSFQPSQHCRRKSRLACARFYWSGTN